MTENRKDSFFTCEMGARLRKIRAEEWLTARRVFDSAQYPAIRFLTSPPVSDSHAVFRPSRHQLLGGSPMVGKGKFRMLKVEDRRQNTDL